MKPYVPMSARERSAAALISSTVSLSLLAGLLLMFNGGRIPGTAAPGEALLAELACGVVAMPTAPAAPGTDEAAARAACTSTTANNGFNPGPDRAQAQAAR